ncbi:MAG: GlxA family transcriptional regulator [Cellvibrionaceae bacterium]|nr:GlxA family transcriptional regulator [Cellvibrionaceae bacterium]
MFGDSPERTPLRISFLLIPGFSMIGVSALIDPLRWANHLQEKSLYQWQVISPDGKAVAASNGLEMAAAAALTEVEQTDILIVCAGFNPQQHESPSLFAELRRLGLCGADIGGQDTGCHLLAAAGLLDGYRATIHWENLGSFSEAFPRVKAVKEIFEVDRDRFSCSGGLGGLDMMLHLIQSQYGSDLAQTVSEQLIYSQRRQGDHPQRLSVAMRFGVNNPKLVAAIKIMQRSLEDPMRIRALAQEVHVSERELERLFRKFLATTPASFYRNLRLDQARLLLRQTARSVTSVAVASGFTSVSHFSRCYQRRFGIAPSRDRANHQMAEPT